MKLLTPEFGLLIWTLLAFLIVFFILKKMAWPAIIKGLHEREKGIADSLSTAERVCAEIAQLQNENEALLALDREERSKLLKEEKKTKIRSFMTRKSRPKAKTRKTLS